MIDSALRGSRMDSGFYQTFFRWVLERDREAHKFTVSNAHKDMKYLAAMAETAGIANPVGSAVKNYFALAQASGRGEDFVPMLSDFVAELNGVMLGYPPKK
jgi:3-hydroxyisobutyrate dehydrogenase-like beta-hydroxyacid dehydrogenase